MFKDILILSARFVLLVFLQIIVLNHVQMGGFCNPYLYVWFLLFLPYRIFPTLLLLLAFLLGMTIDLSCGTAGMHAFACVAAAFVRYLYLKNSTATEHDRGRFPSMQKSGFSWYVHYAALIILVHHLALFWIESFAWGDLLPATGRALCSAIMTLLLVICCELLSFRRS